MTAFLEKSYEIGYFALKDSYSVQITDLPATITSITVNGTTKQVYNYVGGPRELFELEHEIDDVAGTRFWIANYEEGIVHPGDFNLEHLVVR